MCNLWITANTTMTRDSLVAQTVKNLPATQDTWVQSLGWEDPLEKRMVTLSSNLAWRIPWTEEPGRLQSVGLQRVGHDWVTKPNQRCLEVGLGSSLNSKSLLVWKKQKTILCTMSPSSHQVSRKNPGWFPSYPVKLVFRVSHLRGRQGLFFWKEDF